MFRSSAAAVLIALALAHVGGPAVAAQDIEVQLRDFAERCLGRYPGASLYTVHEDGYPFPVAVECLFDRTQGREAVMVQSLGGSRIQCSDDSSADVLNESSASCSAPARHRQEFDPSTLPKIRKGKP